MRGIFFYFSMINSLFSKIANAYMSKFELSHKGIRLYKLFLRLDIFTVFIILYIFLYQKNLRTLKAKWVFIS